MILKLELKGERRRVSGHCCFTSNNFCPWSGHSIDTCFSGVKYTPGYGPDCHQSIGLEKPKYEPVFLLYYSETDFACAHYQSIRPKAENNVVETFVIQNEVDRNSISLINTSHSVSITDSTSLELSEVPVMLKLARIRNISGELSEHSSRS